MSINEWRLLCHGSRIAGCLGSLCVGLCLKMAVCASPVLICIALNGCIYNINRLLIDFKSGGLPVPPRAFTIKY